MIAGCWWLVICGLGLSGVQYLAATIATNKSFADLPEKLQKKSA